MSVIMTLSSEEMSGISIGCDEDCEDMHRGISDAVRGFGRRSDGAAYSYGYDVGVVGRQMSE